MPHPEAQPVGLESDINDLSSALSDTTLTWKLQEHGKATYLEEEGLSVWPSFLPFLAVAFFLTL